jgi:hypothetical protein
MTNVYVFRGDANTPTDWSEIAECYRNRLILGGETPLNTGGAASHNHTTTPSVANSSTYSEYQSTTGSGYPYNQYVHGHGVASTDIQNATNFPPYKDFRLVYRNVVGWNGKIPAGSIVFNETVPTGYNRVDAGSQYYIRISGTAGGTGGAADHYHSCGVALYNATLTSARINAAGTPTNWRCNITHGHDIVYANSTSQTYSYKYWGAGLISADSDAQVKQNSYLLFDGTPDEAQWEVIDFTGRYLACLSAYTVGTGNNDTSFSHTHTYSFNSNGPNALYNIRNGSTDTPSPHTHTISGTLDSATVQPSYVVLTLARAKNDITGGGARTIFVMGC